MFLIVNSNYTVGRAEQFLRWSADRIIDDGVGNVTRIQNSSAFLWRAHARYSTWKHRGTYTHNNRLATRQYFVTRGRFPFTCFFAALLWSDSIPNRKELLLLLALYSSTYYIYISGPIGCIVVGMSRSGAVYHRNSGAVSFDLCDLSCRMTPTGNPLSSALRRTKQISLLKFLFYRQQQ